jgi:thiaminase
MNIDEIQYIDSKVDIINRRRLFSDMMNPKNKLKAFNNNKNIKNDNFEKSFIDELDDRTVKLEKLKDVLKGDAFYLEPKKKRGKDANKSKKSMSQIKKMSII